MEIIYKNEVFFILSNFWIFWLLIIDDTNYIKTK